jgi:hypothetical protein
MAGRQIPGRPLRKAGIARCIARPPSSLSADSKPPGLEGSHVRGEAAFLRRMNLPE